MAKPRFDARKARAKAHDRALGWAGTGSEYAAQTHANAPRGGTNLNVFGQPRSAPGEPPATEFGDLLRAIQAGPFPEGQAWIFNVNRENLEFGESHAGVVVEPRPLGAMTLAFMKARARGGRGP